LFAPEEELHLKLLKGAQGKEEEEEEEEEGTFR